MGNSSSKFIVVGPDAKERDNRTADLLSNAKSDFKVKWRVAVQKSEDTAGLNDYKILKTLGEGAFGKVILVQNIETHVYSAMKMISKKMIVLKKQIPHILNEKRVLQSVDFPFVLNLIAAFQDNVNLYFVIPFIAGGEMFTVLQKAGRFTEEQSRFYCAQVALAFEYLHYLGIIYRDLKPENLLLDCEGYVKVTDFGFAKIVEERTYTFCGTPEYLAPEIIKNKGYGKAVDWWSFGVLIYELNAGYPPFENDNPIKLYETIVSGIYRCPSYFNNDLKNAISCFLQLDTSRRFGNLKNGSKDVKNLKWFAPVKWIPLYERKVKPPFVPECKSPDDLSNFSTKAVHPITIPKASTDRFALHFQEF